MRADVTQNDAKTFTELAQSLEFEVHHFHGTDHDLEDGSKLVIHLDADGFVTGGDIGSIIGEQQSPQDWDSLVADEWH